MAATFGYWSRRCVLLPPAADLLALGLHIRRLREQQGLSIEDLAAAAGMSWRGLIDIEHGRRNTTYRSLAALARALDTSLVVPVPETT